MALVEPPSEPRPKCCMRCGRPLIDVTVKDGFDSATGELKVHHELKCSRFGRPWWRRLGRPATFHDVYSVREFNGRVSYSLADWK